MRARVFLEDNFFNVFNNYQPVDSIHDVDYITDYKNQLVNILKQSEFHSTISTKQYINIHKKLIQNYQTTDVKEILLFRAMRSGKLFLNPLDNKKPFSLFLLEKCHDDIHSFNKLNNTIGIGVDYNFKTPIIPKSFASIEVNKEMVGIDSINHRCRNAIIIDPYLFEDQPKKEPKIPNIIKFLKEIFFDNTDCECHLSILITNPNNNGKVESKINAIKEGINNPKLKISVYAHREGLLNNNRHIITDYSIIDYQHLFDRNASISFASLYDGEINKKFIRVNNLLEKIKNDYIKTPVNFAKIKNKFDDILDNGLFEELD